MSNTREFITVDWCNEGRRGVFCNREGIGYSRVAMWSDEEMQEILGPFALILHPLSEQLSEAEVKQYTQWKPLAEYSGAYGVARGDA